VAEDGCGRLLASVYTEVRGARGFFGMRPVDPVHQCSGLGRVMVEADADFCQQQGCEGMDSICPAF
jgi:hypothetical protein